MAEINKYKVPLSIFIREFRKWTRRVELNSIVIITRNGRPVAEMVSHNFQETEKRVNTDISESVKKIKPGQFSK